MNLQNLDLCNPYQSPLRIWLYELLTSKFPSNQLYTSTNHTKLWREFTGIQNYQEWSKRSGATSCTSFLPRVDAMIRNNGTFTNGVSAGEFGNKVFVLDTLSKGWYSFQGSSRPEQGDFYLTAYTKDKGTMKRGYHKHVGIFYYVGDGWCIVIGGGADRRGNYGAIERKIAPYFPPIGLKGWVNIDELYPNWVPH